jgi:hypothetical protein
LEQLVPQRRNLVDQILPLLGFEVVIIVPQRRNLVGRILPLLGFDVVIIVITTTIIINSELVYKKSDHVGNEVFGGGGGGVGGG